jgi:hypothetical protein
MHSMRTILSIGLLLAVACSDRSTPVDSSLPRDGVGSGGTLCDPAKATCRSLPTPCAIGQVRAIVSGCWGDCVAIESCQDLPAQPDCDLSHATCERVPPSCLDRYLPSVTNSCFGPCVPDLTCACVPGGPAGQCPSPHASVCHQVAKRCGPLE